MMYVHALLDYDTRTAIPFYRLTLQLMLLIKSAISALLSGTQREISPFERFSVIDIPVCFELISMNISSKYQEFTGA